MTFKIITTLALFSQINIAHAGSSSCKQDMMPTAQTPACPKNGMYSDLFPTKAIALSENKGNGQHNPQMVQALLKADQKNFPTILFSGTRDTFNSMRKVIEDTIKDPKEKERLLNQLVYSGNATMPWTQDNSQNYIGADGRPVYRQISTPSYATNLLSKLFDSSVRGSKQVREELNKEISQAIERECGLKPGETIMQNQPIKGIGLPGVGRYDGYLGGNIEGGPGNTCLIGRASFEKEEFDQHLDKVCPKGSTVVQIPTYLSGTGHLDEMIKVVSIPGAKAPCNYALLVSDIQTGYDLLKNSNQKFFGFDRGAQDNASQSRTNDVLKYDVFQEFCKYLKNSELAQPPANPAQQTRSVASVTSFLDCSQMTDAQVYTALSKSKHFTAIKDSWQQRFDRLYADAIPAIERGSGCSQPAKVVKVPAFFDGKTVPIQGGKLIALGAAGRPLTPSAANSVQINKTLIMPDPFSPTFKAYTDQQLKKLGIESSYIDTLNQHNQYGNVHCLVQQFQVCRP